MENDFDAAKRTGLEKALAAAREKLEWEQTMVATYNKDKVDGAQAAVDAIEELFEDEQWIEMRTGVKALHQFQSVTGSL